MSHSNIKAPASPKCGTCFYFNYHHQEWPCSCCKDNSNYKPDMTKMSITEILKEKLGPRK